MTLLSLIALIALLWFAVAGITGLVLGKFIAGIK